jgi:hypothetical protein
MAGETVVATASVVGEAHAQNQIISELRAVRGELAAVGKQGKKTSADVKKVDSGFKQFGKTLKAGAMAAGITLSAQALLSFGKAATEAAMAGQLATITLEAMTDSSTRAASAMNAIDSATRGVLSSTQQAQLSAKLFSLGLADNITEAKRFTSAAATLGLAFRGLDPGESVALFQRMITNRSVKLLDDFGLGIGEINAKMRELGVTGQEGFQTAVIEVATEKAAELGDVWESDAVKLQQLTAAWKDFKASFGGAIADFLFVQTGTSDLQRQKQDIVLMADSVRDANQALREFSKETDVDVGIFFTKGALEDMQEAIILERELAAEAELADASIRGVADAYQTFVLQADTDAMTVAADQLNALQKASEDYLTAIEQQASIQLSAQDGVIALTESEAGLAEVYGFGVDMLDGYNLSAERQLELQNALGLATGQVTEEQIAAAEAGRTLTNLWDAGILSAEEYANALVRIQEGGDPATEATRAMNSELSEMAQQNPGLMMLDFAENVEKAADGLPVTLEELQLGLMDLQETLGSLDEVAMLEFETNSEEAMEEVQGYIDRIGLVPDDTQTAANIETAVAIAAVNRYIAKLRQLPGTVSTTTTFHGEGGGSGSAVTEEALGGPVTAGNVHLVGERGPEIFIPERTGTIIPNSQLQSATGGGMAIGGGSQIFISVTFTGVIDSRTASDVVDGLDRELRSRGQGFVDL